MKINGQSLSSRFTRSVELPRADGSVLILTLQPLPLGFHRRLREHQVIPPSPPTRIARDSTGKPLRDAAGLAVVMADEQDSRYREELEVYHQRVAVLVLVEALQSDPQIELETVRPAGDWRGYADAVYAELEQAGWSAGDLLYLCRIVSEMSNLSDRHLREATANFSSAEAETPW